MPAVRRTPARNPYSFFDAQPTDSPDSGFNPAWAQAPPTPRNQPFVPPPATGFPSFEFKVPAQSQFAPQTPNPPGWYSATPNPARNDDPPQGPNGNPMPAPSCRVESVKPAQHGTIIDKSTFLVMLPFAALYYVSEAVKTGAKMAMDMPGLGTQAVRNVMGWKLPKAQKGKKRFNPMSRGGRKTPKKEKESMLALPPYIVGATPNVVRKSRGQRLRGQREPKTPTAEEARKWKLFHNTPLPKEPRPETPGRDDIPATPGPSTPGYQNPSITPYGHDRNRDMKALAFQREIKKKDYNKWVKQLHKYDVHMGKIRMPLIKKYKLPTEGILKMEKADDKTLEVFAECLTDVGFTSFHRLILPAPTYPEVKGFAKGKRDIILESYVQQLDGCCKTCRGYAWAGKIETRKIKKGESVPVKSMHKTVVPYTDEEKEAFEKGQYDMLYRRWCQESRYDWIFETPNLDKNDTGDYIWKIPQDDPRLRHLAIQSMERRPTRTGQKMYHSEAASMRQQLIELYTKEDIAAKILIDAIRAKNAEVGKLYEAADLERKRSQVKVELLCVRQVQVEVEDPDSKPVEEDDLVAEYVPPTMETEPAVEEINPDFRQSVGKKRHLDDFEMDLDPEHNPWESTYGNKRFKPTTEDDILVQEKKEEPRFGGYGLDFDSNNDLVPIAESTKKATKPAPFAFGPQTTFAPKEDVLKLRPSRRVVFNDQHIGPTQPLGLESPSKSILKKSTRGINRAAVESPTPASRTGFVVESPIQNAMKNMKSLPFGASTGNAAPMFQFQAGGLPKVAPSLDPFNNPRTKLSPPSTQPYTNSAQIGSKVFEPDGTFKVPGIFNRKTLQMPPSLLHNSAVPENTPTSDYWASLTENTRDDFKEAPALSAKENIDRRRNFETYERHRHELA